MLKLDVANDKYKIRSIWADAICIDQANEENKRKQILSMRIYISMCIFCVSLAWERSVGGGVPAQDCACFAKEDYANDVGQGQNYINLKLARLSPMVQQMLGYIGDRLEY